MGWLITLTILAVCALVGLIMWFGWRHRVKSQADLSPAPELPEGLEAPLFAVDDAHYVATSRTGDALDRIAVRPLGFRGRAVVELHRSGVAIGITAERPFFIPRESLTLVARTQATIDRAVEPDGLLVLQWQLDEDNSVETYLRVVDPKQRAAMLDTLAEIYPELATAKEQQ